MSRFQFRRDGTGYEIKLIVGNGKSRKRKYLAYLSRADYDRMAGNEIALVEWANQKLEEKGMAA